MTRKTPKVWLVNPSRITTEKGFVMPAAQVTLAGAIPERLDVEPIVIDEIIERFNPAALHSEDIVCISCLTNNCLDAYRVTRQAKERGATVVMGGPHPTLLPEEPFRFGVDAVVRGDGDTIFGQVLEDGIMGRIFAGKIYQDFDCKGKPQPFRVAGDEMAYPRLDLVALDNYMTASIRSNSGCQENCGFCTVPTIGGHVPRVRLVEQVAREVRELHDRGIRFVLWGADNLVQVPLSLVKTARNSEESKVRETDREESLTFFRTFAKLVGEKKPWGFAQLTLRLNDDPEMLEALHDAGITAALFGIESVDPIALKRMAKQWNGTRDEICEKVRKIQSAGIHVLGSMIVGLPTDTPETIEEMRQFSYESGMSVAQFPVYEILPGSPDYLKAKRELLRKSQGTVVLPIISTSKVATSELVRDEYWLETDQSLGPHLKHPTMSHEMILEEGRKSWQYFYTLAHLFKNSWNRGWKQSGVVTYVAACKAFAGFYGGRTGFSADSARDKPASFLQKKVMAIGVWLMHRIPTPKPSQKNSLDKSPLPASH